MKSINQIIQDKIIMDMEQQECVERCSIPNTWAGAPELNVLFEQLNKTLFSSMLPKVPCYWSPPVRGFLGRCHARVHPKTQNMHSVALEFPSSSTDGAFLDTMIHEMVHVYQTVMGVPLNHDRLFRCILKRKRATYIQKNKGLLEPLLYPPRNTKKNKKWIHAPVVESQLSALSEVLFETPVPVPKCWWHTTKTRTRYTLESYWCHTDQISKPNSLELAQKICSPTEYDLIYILSTIVSWNEIGNHKRREHRNELFFQKIRTYHGTPTLRRLSPSEGPTMDIKR